MILDNRIKEIRWVLSEGPDADLEGTISTNADSDSLESALKEAKAEGWPYVIREVNLYDAERDEDAGLEVRFWRVPGFNRAKFAQRKAQVRRVQRGTVVKRFTYPSLGAELRIIKPEDPGHGKASKQSADAWQIMACRLRLSGQVPN